MIISLHSCLCSCSRTAKFNARKLVLQDYLESPLSYTYCDKPVSEHKDKSCLLLVKFHPDWSDDFSHQWLQSYDQSEAPYDCSPLVRKTSTFSATAHANLYSLNFLFLHRHFYYVMSIHILLLDCELLRIPLKINTISNFYVVYIRLIAERNSKKCLPQHLL